MDFYLIYRYICTRLACLPEKDAPASADLFMSAELGTSDLAGFGPKSIRAKHLALCPEFI